MSEASIPLLTPASADPESVDKFPSEIDKNIDSTPTQIAAWPLTIWIWVQCLLINIFCTQPLKLGTSRGLTFSGLLRGYLYIVATLSLVLCIIPLAGFGGFVLALKGCEYRRFREVDIFQDICIPSPIVDQTGWSSELWNNPISAGEYANAVEPNVRFLMASDLEIDQVNRILIDDVLALSGPNLSDPTANDMLGSTDALRSKLPPFASYMQNFASTTCVEKDRMNFARDTFLEAYLGAMVLDRYYITWPSSVLYPPIHVLRFYSYLSGAWFLPASKPYNIQVKTYLRVLISKLSFEYDEALKKMFSSDSTIIDTVENYLKSAKEKAETHENALHTRLSAFSKEKPTKQSKEQHRLDQSRLEKTRKLRDDLHDLERVIARSRLVLARLRGQSRATQENLASQPTVYIPSVRLVGSKDGSEQDTPETRKARVLELIRNCKDANHPSSPDDRLFCSTYAMGDVSLAEIDFNTATGVRRSWVVERGKIRGDYERRTGTTGLDNALLALDLYREHFKETPNPAEA